MPQDPVACSLECRIKWDDAVKKNGVANLGIILEIARDGMCSHRAELIPPQGSSAQCGAILDAKGDHCPSEEECDKQGGNVLWLICGDPRFESEEGSSLGFQKIRFSCRLDEDCQLKFEDTGIDGIEIRDNGKNVRFPPLYVLPSKSNRKNPAPFHQVILRGENDDKVPKQVPVTISASIERPKGNKKDTIFKEATFLASPS